MGDISSCVSKKLKGKKDSTSLSVHLILISSLWLVSPFSKQPELKREKWLLFACTDCEVLCA